jgi:hypothetical protein
MITIPSCDGTPVPRCANLLYCVALPGLLSLYQLVAAITHWSTVTTSSCRLPKIQWRYQLRPYNRYTSISCRVRARSVCNRRAYSRAVHQRACNPKHHLLKQCVQLVTLSQHQALHVSQLTARVALSPPVRPRRVGPPRSIYLSSAHTRQ